MIPRAPTPVNRFSRGEASGSSGVLGRSGRAPGIAGTRRAVTIGPMRVIFIAAECEPWAKVGGLGDVVDALARAMAHVPDALDEPIEVFLPRYRCVSIPAGTTLDARQLRVPDPSADASVEVTLRSFQAEGYRLRLVDHPPAYDRDGVYGDAAGDFPDNARRFALLARAALETRRAEGRPVDVIALHDWHACPAALFRDLAYADDPVIGRAAVTLTLHNLSYHGWTPRDRVAQLGLGDDPAIGDAWGVNLLREGIRRAEVVNTVSPTYAREVLRPEMGGGLDGDLIARGTSFVGILNGIDEGLWDPSRDGAIAAPYDANDRTGKAACREDLCARVGFDGADPAPILGVVGRLDPQKGFDLVAGAAPALAADGARIVALGSGDPGLVAGMRAAAAAHPGRIAMVERFDRDLARRIYAGADLFLMPSRFEPCGQGQMIAMRYGTPPVARRTGGLADTIVDLHEDPAGGTGFLFDDETPDALRFACERAVAVLRDPDRRRWDGMVGRAMATDWAWERASAPAYAAMFERAVDARRRTLDTRRPTGWARDGRRTADGALRAAGDARRTAGDTGPAAGDARRAAGYVS
jgi:starch synthase